MKKKYYLIIGIACIVLVSYLVWFGSFNFGDSGAINGTSFEETCKNAGGTVKTQLCCQSVSDFPNNCLIGACGCSPDNSKEVKVCDCGEGRCWNMTTCISNSNP